MRVLVFALVLVLGACAARNEAAFWGGVAREMKHDK